MNLICGATITTTTTITEFLEAPLYRGATTQLITVCVCVCVRACVAHYYQVRTGSHGLETSRRPSLPTQDHLRSALEVELVTKVNQVGVDVNFCLEHPHAVGMLNFVCGLGPRKSAALLKVCCSVEINTKILSGKFTGCIFHACPLYRPFRTSVSQA